MSTQYKLFFVFNNRFICKQTDGTKDEIIQFLINYTLKHYSCFDETKDIINDIDSTDLFMFYSSQWDTSIYKDDDSDKTMDIPMCDIFQTSVPIPYSIDKVTYYVETND